MGKDVIARLKVDDKQWNNGLSNAEKSLHNFKKANYTTDAALQQSTKTLLSVAAKYATLGAAISTAMKVAGDAFMKNEQNVDEWGRIVQSAQSLYSGFLNALNTGNINGYLQNMGEIVKAARDAYDAMDELSTFNAFNQRKFVETRAGMQNAINDYREGKATKEDVQAATDAYIQQLQTRQEYEANAYREQINSVAKDNGVDANELYRIMTGDFQELEKAKAVQMTGVNYSNRTSSTGYSMMIEERFAQNDAEKMGEALRQFNDDELNALQQIGKMEVQTALEIEAARKQVDRVLGITGKTTETKIPTVKVPAGESVQSISGIGNISGKGFGTGTSMAELEAQRSYWSNQLNNSKNVYDTFTANSKLKEVNAEIKLKLTELTTSEDAVKQFSDLVTNMLKSEGGLTLHVDTKKSLSDVKTSADGIAQAFQSAAGAMGNFSSQSKEAAVAAQGFTIAAAIAQLVGQFASIPKGVEIWSWIAGTIAGVGTLTAAIASIKSASSFADGGIVPGAYNGGHDSTYAYVSPGELILNRSQQNNIAGQLAGGGGSSRPYVTGQTLYLGINNYLKGAGMGQLVTSRG